MTAENMLQSTYPSFKRIEIQVVTVLTRKRAQQALNAAINYSNFVTAYFLRAYIIKPEVFFLKYYAVKISS